MSRITERFAALKAQKRSGFIPFIVAGDPDLETTCELLSALSKLDPVALEVGIPFSDPTADGPVIQRAAERALSRGTSLRAVLDMIGTAQGRSLCPIVLFSYYNPILHFGIERFARAAAACGISGVLAVDLPAEAAGTLHRTLKQHDIDLIFLVAPTTSEQRLRKIARIASGFIYAVARTGVTGAARDLIDESERLVARIRAVSPLPVAVGFGISDRKRARQIARYADAVVVGSHLVGEIEDLTRRDRKRSTVIRQVMQCGRQFTSIN